MKLISFINFIRWNLSFVLLFICAQLYSKPFPSPRNGEKFPSYFFFRTYTQAQYFFYKEHDGILDVKFPYTIINGNNSNTYTFSSSKNNLTGSGKFSYTFPGIEIGYGRFSVDANMNFLTGPVWGWTDNFYFGMSYRLGSPFVFLRTNQLKLASVSFTHVPQTDYSPWRVVLHAGIEYYHPLYLLGKISMGDNEHFYAAGHTLPHMDTTVTSPGNVSVYFQQNTISFAPALELSYRPGEKSIDFGIRIAPLIMLSQHGGLRFRYKNTLQTAHAPGGYNLEYINLQSGGVETNYNGEPISDTPFRLNGFMIGVHVGCRFGGW